MRLATFLVAVLAVFSAQAAPLGLEKASALESIVQIQPELVARQAALPEPDASGRFPIARGVVTGWTSSTTGLWERLPSGEQVWRARVFAEGAVSVGVALSQDFEVAGQQLAIYSPEGDSIRSLRAPSRAGGVVHSPLISGHELVVELALPASTAVRPTVRIEQVKSGQYDPNKADAPQKSGACNIDVVCPEGDDWRAEIRSVARFEFTELLLTYLCTGQLLNNTAEDFRPLFLTANHCVSRENVAQSVNLYWNYETSSCGGTPDGSLAQVQGGATLLATNSDSDFSLLELTETPSEDFAVYYAGWDASGTTPAGAIAIHHPSGDEKRISFEYDALTATNYSEDDPDANGTHWRIEDWDLGTTEGGSSGSAIWDPNHRVIGQLHGGAAACGNDDPDWYGRLSVSWDNGADDNSLKPHLDPDNSGVLTLDGADPSGNEEEPDPGEGGSTAPDGSSGALGWLTLSGLLIGFRLRRRRRL